MQLQILSDVHVEFHKDNGFSFFKKLNKTGDVLILAGDIFSDIEGALNAFQLCAERWDKVFFVAGNHEYYGTTQQDGVDTIRAACYNSGVLWLDKAVDWYENQRFLGCTLWYTEDPLATVYERDMGDFSFIKDSKRKWMYEEAKKDIHFLEQNVHEGDIVVTHMLPSYASVAPMFKNSALNRFFVNNVEKLILDRQPKLWVHGHTHFSCDYMIDKTRVVCNPFGYVGMPMGMNKGFNEELTITV